MQCNIMHQILYTINRYNVFPLFLPFKLYFTLSIFWVSFIQLSGYFVKARTIQELAKKKFVKLRIGVERSEKDSKIEQKTKSNFLAKKQTKKTFCRTTQESVGSDFSLGASLATAGDIQNSSITIQANAIERPSHADVLVEGNSSLADYNLEKTEELSSGIKSPFQPIFPILIVAWNTSGFFNC